MKKKTTKKVLQMLMLVFLIAIMTTQGVYASSLQQDDFAASNIDVSRASGNVGILVIPGTDVSRFTVRKTFQVNQYTSNETKVTTDTITITGETLDSLDASVSATLSGLTGSGVSASVGAARTHGSGFAATITVVTTHQLKVLHTVFHVYDITYETITDLASGRRHTSEINRTFIDSYVETRYI
ncbi:MAG: hypothetical protein COA82_07520 [Alkaliphilus sp.]|nr:hypothetical protein [Alkaliphilus transvaalensis]PHS34217.1 MAG: hypothetical protein COA82_07520 [Alkaliphilus sp.]